MSQLRTGAAQPVTLELPTGSLAALQAGSSGPVVLLAPGYTGSKEDFGPLLDPIADAGFRAVAVDLPGQYQSPGPADPAAYSPAVLGALVAALAQQLGGTVHLVGHSYGGLVSRAAILSAAPQTFASLVLMASGPGALDGGRRERLELMRPALASLGVAGVYDALEAAERDDPDHVADPPELAAFFRRRFLAGAPEMLLGMGDALLTEPDRVAELAATGVPALVIYGTADDAWAPAVQAEMAVRLGAEQVVLDGVGHSPAVEAPDATVAALVGFWRGVS